MIASPEPAGRARGSAPQPRSIVLVHPWIGPDRIEECNNVCRFVTTPNGIAHRQKVCPGLDQRRAVRWRNAADGHAGQFENSLPPLQQVKSRNVLRIFRARRVKRAKGHIVRARLTGVHGEMTAIVAGHADLGVPTKAVPGVLHIAVVLPEMHPVGLDAPAQAMAELRSALLNSGFSSVDYAEIRDAESLELLNEIEEKQARIFVAARIGQTRLIDNKPL